MAKVMDRDEFKAMLKGAGVKYRQKPPAGFLSRKEFAERVGVLPDSLNRYTLPPADVTLNGSLGWRPETVDAWNEARPGRGRSRVNV